MQKMIALFAGVIHFDHHTWSAQNALVANLPTALCVKRSLVKNYYTLVSLIQTVDRFTFPKECDYLAARGQAVVAPEICYPVVSNGKRSISFKTACCSRLLF